MADSPKDNNETTNALSADFPAVEMLLPQLLRRLEQPHINQELLIKAIGKGKFPRVLDATGGLGRDALLMALVSQEVVVCERNTKAYDYLQRLLRSSQKFPTLFALAQKITLHPGCAITYLDQNDVPAFDVIYCDPMFPEKSKLALPKKDAQLLQAIVGEDLDSEALIAKALTKAGKRVVVKRPRHSPALIKKPDIQYTARAHRFDVYLMH